MTNVTFEGNSHLLKYLDVPSSPYATLQLTGADNLSMTDIKFNNYTGNSIPLFPILKLIDTPQNSAVFTDISISNSSLMNQNFM